jgi:hypothetical protein
MPRMNKRSLNHSENLTLRGINAQIGKRPRGYFRRRGLLRWSDCLWPGASLCVSQAIRNPGQNVHARRSFLCRLCDSAETESDVRTIAGTSIGRPFDAF